MVLRPGSPEEGHAPARLAGRLLEAQHIAVERDGPVDVAHVQDGMVEAPNGDHVHETPSSPRGIPWLSEPY